MLSDERIQEIEAWVKRCTGSCHPNIAIAVQLFRALLAERKETQQELLEWRQFGQMRMLIGVSGGELREKTLAEIVTNAIRLAAQKEKG